ncbi:hypothetical protein CPB84DRAFT_1844039 [Gymnopilus junonius]|uniref:DUF4139 domain-containing protein n=1 Tax=Gymnopilus junonius TaxID=109634 RepID=A0A9P5TQH6_GYMJU|nr:hypothetical protein CPB84DRAFT_1844039 [Gymnopilus junonius]
MVDPTTNPAPPPFQPVKIIDVASVQDSKIISNTGEDWNDVPLALETASPTFGLGVPTLVPWTLSIYRPVAKTLSRKTFGMSSALLSSQSSQPPTIVAAPPRGDAFNEAMGSGPYLGIEHRGLLVSSKGTVSATFDIPGLTTVPSDGVGHNVTIVRLALDATMNWVCVPKKDIRVHLKAKVKNASEYSLLPGKASVYVDGSFISKSDIPLVSPEESFDCPLDNIKIRIMDQVPVSEDSSITVKLVQPALTLPNLEGTSSISSGKIIEPKIPPPIKVSSGVTALWDGADEVADGNVDDIAALGRDGRFSWICSVPPQGKVG